MEYIQTIKNIGTPPPARQVRKPRWSFSCWDCRKISRQRGKLNKISNIVKCCDPKEKREPTLINENRASRREFLKCHLVVKGGLFESAISPAGKKSSPPRSRMILTFFYASFPSSSPTIHSNCHSAPMISTTKSPSPFSTVRHCVACKWPSFAPTDNIFPKSNRLGFCLSAFLNIAALYFNTSLVIEQFHKIK